MNRIMISFVGTLLALVPACGVVEEPSTEGKDSAEHPPSDGEQTTSEPTGEAAQEAGVLCVSPADCVRKCVAEKKWCWAERAEHPYKAPLIGALEQCIDSFPPAKLGGSYTCNYKYTNGDVCVFSYGSKLGPLHFPAPPPFCVYKTT